jgi:hypothetical protein
MQTHQGTAEQFGLVRVALAIAVTVAAIGAIFFRQPDSPDPILGYAAAGVAVMAIGAVFFLRERAGAVQGQQARTYTVFAWAVGEMAALFGWVIHYMGASVVWALPGTLVFLIALFTVPVPRD